MRTVAMLTPIVSTVSSHFATIDQLTLRNEAVSGIQVSPTPAPSPLRGMNGYAPYILFLLLFISALGVLFIRKIRNTRDVIIGVLIAVFAASIPTVITYMRSSNYQTTNAGPNETPRNVNVRTWTRQSVLVTWSTVAQLYGGVRYGAAPFTQTQSLYRFADDSRPMTEHSVIIPVLTENTPYDFEIQSGSNWYDNGGTYIRFVFQSQ